MSEAIRDIRLHKRPRVVDKAAQRKAAEAVWREVCRLVEIRDRLFCRACRRRVVKTLSLVPERLEHHHVIPRSCGGLDTESNVAIVCQGCHSDRHITRTLSMLGRADQVLRFERDGKVWHG
jgi:5-methylcytosine-specific restriction endonuclease McrA